jgi:hypothetical protein
VWLGLGHQVHHQLLHLLLELLVTGCKASSPQLVQLLLRLQQLAAAHTAAPSIAHVQLRNMCWLLQLGYMMAAAPAAALPAAAPPAATAPAAAAAAAVQSLLVQAHPQLLTAQHLLAPHHLAAAAAAAAAACHPPLHRLMLSGIPVACYGCTACHTCPAALHHAAKAPRKCWHQRLRTLLLLDQLLLLPLLLLHKCTQLLHLLLHLLLQGDPLHLPC